MKRLNIDIETYSETDLTKSGVYKYVDKTSGFEVLLFGYAVDGGPVTVIDLARGERIPEEIVEAIKDPAVLKYAFNAQFERVCLGALLSTYLSPDSWRCTMVASLYLGLPVSLAQVGAVLGVEKQKLESGKDLIKYFSDPCKATKTNGGRTRNLPEHDIERWEQFKAYNKRDVETEMEIFERVNMFPVPDFLWKQYAEDQRINDFGIELDMELVAAAIACDKESRDRYLKRAQQLTGLDNPNSPIQLKEWIASKGVEMESLAKAEVATVLEHVSGDVKEVLELRQLLSKSSVKKYVAMENCRCSDGRAHGLLQFYGANRTGRWAGRLIQVQNLPQNHIQDLKVARNLVKSGCFETVELLYDSVPDTLSQLIRTAFVPRSGCKFIVADFSAIEARVIAWLAGEHWRQEVFKNNGDIYCASASQMFGVPVEKHGENAHLRQKGKIAELALGYGGGQGAMISMGALDMGIAEEEIQQIVDSWRQANPNIVKLWWDIHKCVIKAVRDRQPQQYKCLNFIYEKGLLFIGLPSGRRLAYVKPSVYRNKYDRDEISYMGVDASKKWGSISSYGPKFVENIIQAMSRDILAEAMSRLMSAGYRIVMHVHDEAVIEAPINASLEEACQIMSIAPGWTPGLILNAAGYECEFYQKD
jgi:DNA polymerase